MVDNKISLSIIIIGLIFTFLALIIDIFAFTTKGQIGLRGPTGQKGPNGDPNQTNFGPKGPQGPIGMMGVQGNQGPQGINGDPYKFNNIVQINLSQTTDIEFQNGSLLILQGIPLSTTLNFVLVDEPDQSDIGGSTFIFNNTNSDLVFMSDNTINPLSKILIPENINITIKVDENGGITFILDNNSLDSETPYIFYTTFN